MYMLWDPGAYTHSPLMGMSLNVNTLLHYLEWSTNTRVHSSIFSFVYFFFCLPRLHGMRLRVHRNTMRNSQNRVCFSFTWMWMSGQMCSSQDKTKTTFIYTNIRSRMMDIQLSFIHDNCFVRVAFSSSALQACFYFGYMIQPTITNAGMRFEKK